MAFLVIKARKPWVEARNNAENAERWLANYIQQDGGSFVIMGYSLGARVVYYCLDGLRSSMHSGAIRNVYLFGGAVDNKVCRKTQPEINWYDFDKIASEVIHNYYSNEDSIL